MRREDGSRPGEEPPAANAIRRLRFRAFLLRNTRAGRTQKRGQRSLGLRAEVFQPKGAEDSCIAAAFSMPSMSRIPPAIRFELPGRCNKRSERNTSSISEQTLETPLQETPRMTLSEERPTGFLHLVASAPPRSKTRPAVVFLQAEIMFLKSPEGSFAFLMH